MMSKMRFRCNYYFHGPPPIWKIQSAEKTQKLQNILGKGEQISEIAPKITEYLPEFFNLPNCLDFFCEFPFWPQLFWKVFFTYMRWYLRIDKNFVAKLASWIQFQWDIKLTWKLNFHFLLWIPCLYHWGSLNFLVFLFVY